MKMMRIIILLLLSIGILLGWSSCTEDIKIDLSSVTPELVVEGTITNEAKVHTIVLKKTGDYFMNESAQMISGANVSLNDGNQNFALVEDSKSPGHYLTAPSFQGVVGRTYTLAIDNVDVDGDGVMESYESKSLLTPVANCDSIVVVKQRLFFHDMWSVKFTLQDPPTERNSYMMRIYRNDVCVSDSIVEWGITTDEFFNGVNMINESVMYFDSRNVDERLVNNDTVALEVCGVSEDYLKFINQVRKEFRGRNPLFGGQPANISTNIRRIAPTSSDGKGARGFFAAYSVSWGRTVYRE